MGSYARVDKRVPELIRRIKCFAKRFEIVGSADGHLNSYFKLFPTEFSKCAFDLKPNLGVLFEAFTSLLQFADAATCAGNFFRVSSHSVEIISGTRGR